METTKLNTPPLPPIEYFFRQTPLNVWLQKLPVSDNWVYTQERFRNYAPHHFYLTNGYYNYFHLRGRNAYREPDYIEFQNNLYGQILDKSPRIRPKLIVASHVDPWVNILSAKIGKWMDDKIVESLYALPKKPMGEYIIGYDPAMHFDSTKGLLYTLDKDLPVIRVIDFKEDTPYVPEQIDFSKLMIPKEEDVYLIENGKLKDEHKFNKEINLPWQSNPNNKGGKKNKRNRRY